MKNTCKILPDYRGKVYLYYSNKSIPLRIPTGIDSNDYINNKNHVDKLLNNLNKIVIDYFYKENNYPTVEYVKSKLKIIYNKMDDIKSLTELFIDYKSSGESEVSRNTLRNIKYFCNTLISFNEINNININYIDDNTIIDFIKYLFNRSINDNSIDKLLSIFKLFIEHVESMNYIKKCNIDWNKIIKKYIKQYQTDKETLTQNELSYLIYKRGEEVHYRKTLNLFLLQCFTGLRHSDLIRINKSLHINEYQLKIFSKKTNVETLIDLNDLTKDILKEMDYNLYYKLSYYNKNIHLMLKEYSKEMESFGKEITLIKITNKKDKLIKFKRYDKISSHTARRTYITNLIEKGVPSNIIMLHSGHTNIDTLNGYINRKSDQETNLSELMISGKKWGE